MMSDVVYGAENRLFQHLRKKELLHMIQFRVVMFMVPWKGLMLEMKGEKQPESIDYILYQISEWINTERPYFESSDAYEDMMNDHLLNPDEENSTELG